MSSLVNFLIRIVNTSNINNLLVRVAPERPFNLTWIEIFKNSIFESCTCLQILFAIINIFLDVTPFGGYGDSF